MKTKRPANYNHDCYPRFKISYAGIGKPSKLELYFSSFDAALEAFAVLDNLFNKCLYVTINNAIDVLYDKISEKDDILDHYGWDYAHFSVEYTEIMEVYISGYPELSHSLTIGNIVALQEG